MRDVSVATFVGVAEAVVGRREIPVPVVLFANDVGELRQQCQHR